MAGAFHLVMAGGLPRLVPVDPAVQGAVDALEKDDLLALEISDPVAAQCPPVWVRVRPPFARHSRLVAIDARSLPAPTATGGG